MISKSIEENTLERNRWHIKIIHCREPTCSCRLYNFTTYMFVLQRITKELRLSADCNCISLLKFESWCFLGETLNDGKEIKKMAPFFDDTHKFEHEKAVNVNSGIIVWQTNWRHASTMYLLVMVKINLDSHLIFSKEFWLFFCIVLLIIRNMNKNDVAIK